MGKYIYWGWDLIGTLLSRISPSKSRFSGLKSGFDSMSTNRSMSISFSLIFFMCEGDGRSFHEDLISECVCSLWFIWYWLSRSQIVTCVTSSWTHSLSVFHSHTLRSVGNQYVNTENMSVFHLFRFCPRILKVTPL